jgi:hypothetical protein
MTEGTTSRTRDGTGQAVQLPTDVAPRRLCDIPGGHRWQDDADTPPVAFRYVPSGQSVQFDEPGTSWYEPMGHGSHVAALLLRLYVPAGHKRHSAKPPGSGANLPTSQEAHASSDVPEVVKP